MVVTRKRKSLKKIKTTKPFSTPQRVSKDFMDLVMEIQAMYLMNKKRPPSMAKISSIIAKKVNKRDLRGEFFR